MKSVIFIGAIYLICAEALTEPARINLSPHRPAIYEAPHYKAPIYEPPVYEAPRYEYPLYLAPFYQPASYKAPHYKPASYKAPDYEPPRYRAPDYEPANYKRRPDYLPVPRPFYTRKVLHRVPVEHQVAHKIFHKSELFAAASGGVETIQLTNKTTTPIRRSRSSQLQQLLGLSRSMSPNYRRTKDQ